MRLKGCPLRPSERRLAECGFLCCPWRRKRWPKLSASRADRTVVSLSKARGGFLQGALGVNWRVRMSRVQSTGSPHWMELCKAKSGRGCTGFAARHAMIMSRYLPSSPVPHVQGQFKSGRATGRGGVVSFPVRPCQAQPIGKRTEPALSPGVQVAVFPGLPMYLESRAGLRRYVEALDSRMRCKSQLPAISGPRKRNCVTPTAVSED